MLYCRTPTAEYVYVYMYKYMYKRCLSMLNNDRTLSLRVFFRKASPLTTMPRALNTK